MKKIINHKSWYKLVYSLFIFAIIVAMAIFKLSKADFGGGITVGVQPTYQAISGDFLYVSNQGSDNVSVIDTNSISPDYNTVIETISVGSAPGNLVLSTANFLYVSNQNSNTVSVIDTDPVSLNFNTVVGTVNVGNAPTSSTVVGNYIYVSNYNSFDISVIDADPLSINFNTVISTINGIPTPIYSQSSNDLLYVSTYTNNNIYVVDIDPLSVNYNTVVATIDCGNPTEYMTISGNYLYIYLSNSTVSVIDIDPISLNFHTVLTNISIPGGWVGNNIMPVNNDNLYVLSQANLKVIDIDPLSVTFNQIIETITVGTTPSVLNTIGNNLYVSNFGSGDISIVDIDDNSATYHTVIDSIVSVTLSNYPIVAGNNIYLSNYFENRVLVVSTITNEVLDFNPPVLIDAVIRNATLTLTYDEQLDDNSNPIVSDFTVTVNAVPVNITSVDVSGSTIVMVLDNIVSVNDVVDISYTAPVVNQIKDITGYDADSFLNELVEMDFEGCSYITVGDYPISSIAVGNKLYVNSSTSSEVNIINTETKIVENTLPLIFSPFGSFYYEDKVLVFGGGGLAAINTTNDSLIINTGAPVTITGDSSVILAGNYIYLLNDGAGNTTVINKDDFSILTTLATGNAVSATLVNDFLYINGSSDNNIYVIDINTNLITDTIGVTAPIYSVSVGNKLYVNSSTPSTIVVVDTTNNSILATIPTTGVDTLSETLVGDNIYINNFNSNTVTVLNTFDDSVFYINVGTNPRYSKLVGENLYVSNYGSNNVSIIDTSTNQVIDTIQVGLVPVLSEIIGPYLYVNSASSNAVYIIDTIINDIASCQTQYNTLNYIAGPNGSILGDLLQYVPDGDDGTLVVATPDAGYIFDEWSDNFHGSNRVDLNVDNDITVTASFRKKSVIGTVDVCPDIVNDPKTVGMQSQIPNNYEIKNGICQPKITVLPPVVIPPVIPPPVITTSGNSTPVQVSLNPVGVPNSNPPLVIPPPIIPPPVIIILPPVGDTCYIVAGQAPTLWQTINCMIEETIDHTQEILESTWNQIKYVFVNPEGNILTKTIAITGLAFGTAFTLLPYLFSTPFSFSELVLMPYRLWSLLMSILGLRKRVRPWGTVYDSVTKQPLDPVVVDLFDAEGKKVQTSITDMDGRYGFLTAPGHYWMRPRKTHYSFPSFKLAGKTRDEIYLDLYFGNFFEVKVGDEIITKNIPMDREHFDWNEFAKKDQKLMKFYSKRDIWLNRIADSLFSFGFFIAFIALVSSQSIYNIIIFALYIIMLIVRETGIKQKMFGRVMMADGTPLSYAVIKVYSTIGNIEVARKVANQYGKYYCLLQNGHYIVTIERKNADESYTLVYTSDTIEVSKGVINTHFKI